MLSPSGRSVGLLAAAALSGLVVPVEVAGVLVAAVVAAFAVDALTVRHPPAVVRRLPAEVVRGAAVPFSVDVDHRPLTRVTVRQPQTGDVRFDPAEAPDRLDGHVVVTRRGSHRVGPAVTRLEGPLRLARWVHRHPDADQGPSADGTIRARVDLPGGRRIAAAVRQGPDRAAGRRRGPLGLGTDFETIRDYLPDDDIRRVNWAATERVGRPMVNTYREDAERDLWCLVDTGRLLASPVGDRTRLDAAVDAVAAVAATADVVGDRVGAVVFDRAVHQVIRPGRHSAAGLATAIDDVEPAIVDSDFAAAFAQVASAKRAMVVVFTDLLDGAAAAGLVDATPVLVRRHAVVVATIADPDLLEAVTSPPPDRRAVVTAGVAADLLAERRAVVDRLTGLGALVVTAPAPRLPGACVDAYLRLKARARL